MQKTPILYHIKARHTLRSRSSGLFKQQQTKTCQSSRNKSSPTKRHPMPKQPTGPPHTQTFGGKKMGLTTLCNPPPCPPASALPAISLQSSVPWVAKVNICPFPPPIHRSIFIAREDPFTAKERVSMPTRATSVEIVEAQTSITSSAFRNRTYASFNMSAWHPLHFVYCNRALK